MRALFFTDMRISVDELWQQSRFDIRFKDIRQIHPYTPGGAIAYSLPFVKRGRLFIWDLEIASKPRLKALVASCGAADASKAAAKAPPTPSLVQPAAVPYYSLQGAQGKRGREDQGCTPSCDRRRRRRAPVEREGQDRHAQRAR